MGNAMQPLDTPQKAGFVTLTVKELRSAFAGLVMRFKRLQLEVQFIIITSIVVLAQVLALGVWTTRTLENAVIEGGGTVGAKYLETFVAPLVPHDDWQDGEISPETEAKLDKLFENSILAEHVMAMRIWNRDGTIFYPSSLRNVAKGEISASLAKALDGKIAAGYGDLHHSSEPAESVEQEDAIEVYAPLVRGSDGTVVLVGEFYENPEYLKSALATQWVSSTAIITIVTVPMLIALFVIARWASGIIGRQYAAFRTSLEQAIKLSTQNRHLRIQAETLRLEAGKSNEMILDQIGCDLHDGPLQVLTLIRLRLSDLGSRLTRRSLYKQELSKLDELLSQAMDDLRNLSAGLVLPEIERMKLGEAIAFAGHRHADMTGTSVAVSGQLPDFGPQAHLNICAYRFVQESLMNAHRHAQGTELRVRYHAYRNWIVLAVANTGQMPKVIEERALKRIKLGGLTKKRRVQAFGGKLRSFTRAGGTVVVAFLPRP